jgi:hypothetical protein
MTRTRNLVRTQGTVPWQRSNPVLALGELSHDQTTRRLKVGDGITDWKGLNYIAGEDTLISVDFAAIAAQVANKTEPLKKGAFYNLTNRLGTSVGQAGDIIVQALDEYEFSRSAILHTKNPDYNEVPLWSSSFVGPAVSPPVSYSQDAIPYVKVAPDAGDTINATLFGDDNEEGVTLPFSFTFGGVDYTQIWIDTNARIVFGDDTGSSANTWELGQGFYANVPLIALCWNDLIVQQAGGVVWFITGTAPNRRCVIQYNNAIPYGGGTGTFSGQVILEETTNKITIGLSEYSLTNRVCRQGIEYSGRSYATSQEQALPVGTSTEFTPVVAPPPPSVQFNPADYPAIFYGQTFWLVGDPTQQPIPYASDPANWVIATGAGRDEHGNLLPETCEIQYDFVSDAILLRRDTRGNQVSGSSIEYFPWGRNTITNCVWQDVNADYSFINKSAYYMSDVELNLCTISNITFQTGATFKACRFFSLNLLNRQIASFNSVVGYYGLPANTSLNNVLVVSEKIIGDYSSVYSYVTNTIVPNYLSQPFIVYNYSSNVSPAYTTLDLFNPVNGDYTKHDVIIFKPSKPANWLCLRNQDYNLNCQGATVARTYFGAATAPRKIRVEGLSCTGVYNIYESNYDNTPNGHVIEAYNCPYIYYLGTWQGAGGGSRDRHLFTNCNIGCHMRQAAYNGSHGHLIVLDRCSIGKFITPASVLTSYFGNYQATSLFDTYDAGTLSMQLTNCTIYLNDGITLQAPGQFSPAPYLSFENCTLVYADGSTQGLSSYQPLTLLNSTRNATDIANLTNAANWNTAGNNTYTGPALLWRYPSYFEAYPTDATRGYRYVSNGSGQVTRYINS